VKLEIGGATDAVEDTAPAAAQLQIMGVQIGNTVSTENILRLPTLQRNATALVNLQPGVVAGGAGLIMRVSDKSQDEVMKRLSQMKKLGVAFSATTADHPAIGAAVASIPERAESSDEG